MSSSSNVMLPPVARISPISVRSSVVLPMPLWPSTPTISPRAMEKSIPFRIGMRP